MPRQFKWSVSVYYADTDAAQIAYHGRYAAWLEEARIEFFNDLNHPYSTILAQDISFIPTELVIHYKSPLVLFDRFTITLTPTLYRARIKMDHVLMKEQTCIATGYVMLACLSTSTFRPRPLPNFIHSLLS